jgi:hypothetical protein
MVDIHHKAPDTRRPRTWRIPTPTKEYKAGYDRIFRKKVPKTKGKKDGNSK